MKQNAIKIICACVLIAGVSTPVQADDGRISWAIDGGVNFVNDFDIDMAGGTFEAEFDPGFRVGLSGLYEVVSADDKGFGLGIGPDVAFLYNEAKDDNDVWLGQVPALLKAVVYTDGSQPFQFFAGAGVGGAWSYLDVDTDDDSEISFAWGAEIGVNYAVSDSAKIGLVGKYLGVNSPEWDVDGDTLDADPIHNFSVGLIFGMGF
jgi:opacity protein-like surface antigen